MFASMCVDSLDLIMDVSCILSGNDLGLLANVENLPLESEIKAFNCSFKNNDEKHQKAKVFLENQDVKNAWLALLS